MDDAVLLTSELVTNAVVHAGTRSRSRASLPTAGWRWWSGTATRPAWFRVRSKMRTSRPNAPVAAGCCCLPRWRRPGGSPRGGPPRRSGSGWAWPVRWTSPLSRAPACAAGRARSASYDMGRCPGRRASPATTNCSAVHRGGAGGADRGRGLCAGGRRGRRSQGARGRRDQPGDVCRAAAHRPLSADRSLPRGRPGDWRARGRGRAPGQFAESDTQHLQQLADRVAGRAGAGQAGRNRTGGQGRDGCRRGQ